MIAIRRILNIKKNKVPLFIEPAVLFLAYVIDRNIKNLIVLYGIQGIKIIITNVVRIVVKSSIGIDIILDLIALQPFVTIVNLGAIGVGGILSFVLLTGSDFKCENYFYKLPHFIEDGTSYIERPVISNEKIYVKGHQDLQIMKLDKIPTQTCTNIPEHIDLDLYKYVELIIKRFGPIMGKLESGSNPNLNKETETRTCVSNKRNYVKLKHRTKMLDDVRVENDSTNMNKVVSLIAGYEKYNKRVRQPIRLKLEED